MIKHIAAIVLAATSFAASAADNTGFYMGADLGKTKVDTMNNDNSVGVFAGYKFTDNLAVEAAYRDMGKFGVGTYYYDPVQRRNVYVSADVDMKQTAISLVASAPLGAHVSMYARLGYNKLSAEVGGYSDSQNGTLVGIGLGYAFTQNVAARIEYQRPASDVQNLSVGISYKF